MRGRRWENSREAGGWARWGRSASAQPRPPPPRPLSPAGLLGCSWQIWGAPTHPAPPHSAPSLLGRGRRPLSFSARWVPRPRVLGAWPLRECRGLEPPGATSVRGPRVPGRALEGSRGGASRLFGRLGTLGVPWRVARHPHLCPCLQVAVFVSCLCPLSRGHQFCCTRNPSASAHEPSWGLGREPEAEG